MRAADLVADHSPARRNVESSQQERAGCGNCRPVGTGSGVLLATLFQPGHSLAGLTAVILPKPVQGIPQVFLTYRASLKAPEQMLLKSILHLAL